MNILLALPTGLASIIASVYLLAFHPDAPSRRVLRAFTVDGPRCVVCNDPAVTAQVYQHDIDMRTQGGKFDATHAFCIQHAGKEQLTTLTWPNLDKYLFNGAAILFYAMAFCAGVGGIFGALSEGEGGAAFAGPFLLGLGWLASHIMTLF